ncbi:cytochrome P450 82A3 [Neltuma alba]|uniref:cytochrome P450 82A3 n=1 Tax=Neltuma alba TaxID=207710 RepID=UPI0010A4350F|nr:cytochrome P450 82A3-like [Prosopis alba]
MIKRCNECRRLLCSQGGELGHVYFSPFTQKQNQRHNMGSVLSSLDAHAAIVGLLSLLLICLLSVIRRSKDHEAEGGWPIIGHLLLLRGPQMPHHTLAAMADKHGPIFSIRLGSRPALVISNWEMAKQCFTANDLAVSSRPALVSVQRLCYNQAMFGFGPYGPYWRQLRKIATQELLSNSQIQRLSQVCASRLDSWVKELFRLWAENKNDSGQVLVDLSERFGRLVTNTVLRTMAGKRYYDGGAEVQEEARRLLETLKEFVRLLGVFVAGDALPCLRWLDLGGYEKAMKKTAKQLDSILEEWLEEHRRKRASAGDQDFMDVLLSVLDGSELGGHDANTIVKATTLMLIAGGVDTSTVTLIWAISRLLSNPNILKEAQRELDIQVGKERAVKESDINKLAYLQAIVKETLRLHPPATLMGPREFTEDCIIGGCRVKKGTRLLTNVWKIQTDPTIWADPLEFKPERFLTTHKDVDVKGHHFELIPFGSGRRICPGISFGLHTIHLILATFLHSFQISKPSDEPIDMTEIFGLTTTKAPPLQALITPRLSFQLYDAL